MRAVTKLLVLPLCLTAAMPALAAYVPSTTTLAGGAMGAVNTSSKAISICWKAGGSAGTCQQVGTFTTASVATVLVNSEGANFFYVIDKASGHVTRCEQTGTPTASVSGWTCVAVSTGLP